MRKNHLYTLILAFAGLLSVVSCGEDRTHEYLEMTEENQWTYTCMRESYLWADGIKSPKREDFFASTSNFFKTLLASGDKVSFFTDTVSAGSYGLTSTIMRDPLGENRGDYYALVLYVEPGSPAAQAGLERGNWISSVGGKKLTSSGLKLLQSGDATDIVRRLVEVDDEGGYSWSEYDTLTISPSADIASASVSLDTIYNIRSGKVGYVVFRNFNNDGLVEHVNEIALGFAAEDITDIVLDLRYCNGGNIENTAAVASIFAPQSVVGAPFAKLLDKDSVVTTYSYPEAAVNLSEKRLYIITGNMTSGVAELFTASVNASRGMHEVVTVGAVTAGANVITEKFESPYGFSINPAVAQMFISNGNTLQPGGITPDYSIDELTELKKVYKLGSEQEYILRNIEYLIVNGMLPASL